MSRRKNRIGVFMLVDPTLGITLEQAKATLDAVLAFNDDGLSLSRAGATGQRSTTTQWPHLLEYVHFAAIERGQSSAVRIFGNLQGMTAELAAEIHQMGALLFGEWFAPSLDAAGVRIMADQGVTQQEAEAMLSGIQASLAAKALTGIEFQVNRGNVGYVEPFIRLCTDLGIEAHLEMQEMQFQRGDDLTQLRQTFCESLPTHAQLRQVAHAVAAITGESFGKLLNPFFCPGNTGAQYGVCNYWFENGLFVKSNGSGGLLRTACLSDQTVIDQNFAPTVIRLKKHLAHPLVAMRQTLSRKQMQGTKCAGCNLWSICRGGCRAMAYLSTGSDFSPDPNCWRE